MNISEKVKEEIKMNLLIDSYNIINKAVEFLRKSNGSPKVLMKIYGNLGDSTNATAIAKHYKLKYPNCVIAFVTKNLYLNAYELNKDFDAIFGLPIGLNPQERIKNGEYITNNFNDVDFRLCPAVFPFGEVWNTHAWSLPAISHQFFSNAKIIVSEMLGDRKLNIPVSDEDLKFANEFIKNKRCIGIEYVSYSHTPFWKYTDFINFVKLMKNNGIESITFAGTNEGLIPGTMDGRGMSWRRTVATLSKCKYMIGIGSGITMLATAARPTPAIIELGVSSSISMTSCGYGTSHNLSCGPDDAAAYIMNAERNEQLKGKT
jgi:ADP-heptose:LPS heptosyltransferase